MRARLALLVAAVSVLTLIAFLVPLALLVRTVAEDRATVRATADAQSLVPVVGTADAATIRLTVEQLAAESGRPVSVFLPDGTVLGAQTPRTPSGGPGRAWAEPHRGVGGRPGGGHCRAGPGGRHRCDPDRGAAARTDRRGHPGLAGARAARRDPRADRAAGRRPAGTHPGPADQRPLRRLTPARQRRAGRQGHPGRPARAARGRWCAQPPRHPDPGAPRSGTRAGRRPVPPVADTADGVAAGGGIAARPGGRGPDHRRR